MNVRPSRASKGGRFLQVRSHVPSYPQTAAKARPVSRAASGFIAETDWLLEGDGFELSSIQRAVSYSPTASCSAAWPPASYRINGETGALTPIAGQCPRGL